MKEKEGLVGELPVRAPLSSPPLYRYLSGGGVWGEFELPGAHNDTHLTGEGRRMCWWEIEAYAGSNLGLELFQGEGQAIFTVFGTNSWNS